MDNHGIAPPNALQSSRGSFFGRCIQRVHWRAESCDDFPTELGGGCGLQAPRRVKLQQSLQRQAPPFAIPDF